MEFVGLKDTIGDHVLVTMLYNRLVLIYFYSFYLYRLKLSVQPRTLSRQFRNYFPKKITQYWPKRWWGTLLQACYIEPLPCPQPSGACRRVVANTEPDENGGCGCAGVDCQEEPSSGDCYNPTFSDHHGQLSSNVGSKSMDQT